MVFMKKVFLLLLAMTLMLTLLLPAPIFKAEASSVYESEVPLHTYRGHGGDREEVQQSFEALVKAAQSGEDLQKFCAEGLEAAAFSDYFDQLAKLEDFSFERVRFSLFYEVKDKPVFENLRTVATIFYSSKKDGKTLRHTDELALAKQGKEAGDWKLWKVVFHSAGIPVDEIALKQLDPPQKGEQIAVIETDIGEIKLRLFPDSAPNTVENFIGLAKKGYYDGLPFNRVYDDFMIQTGALDGSGKEDESLHGGFFDDEIAPDLFHFRGAVAMGNVGPNTNGNQFFLVQKPEATEDDLILCSLPENVKKKYEELGGLPHLDFRYTIFGQVFEGLDLIDKIAKQEADDDGMPLKDPIKMKTIRIEEFEG